MKDRIISALILTLVITAFSGYRVFASSDQSQGISSPETLSILEQTKSRLGSDKVDQLIQAVLPSGYAALCSKNGFNDPDLMTAVKEYNERNSQKMQNHIKDIENNGGLSSDEREAIDKFAYAKVAGDINKGHISCDNLKEKIRSGEWD